MCTRVRTEGRLLESTWTNLEHQRSRRGVQVPPVSDQRHVARHTGHVGRRRSHASTQRAWNACAQPGSDRAVSPSSTAPRHTAHSVAVAAAAAPAPRLTTTTKQGSRAMAASSRPDDEAPSLRAAGGGGRSSWALSVAIRWLA